MTRGVRPIAGIREAKRMATAWGFRLIEMVVEGGAPVRFCGTLPREHQPHTGQEAEA